MKALHTFLSEALAEQTNEGKQSPHAVIELLLNKEGYIQDTVNPDSYDFAVVPEGIEVEDDSTRKSMCAFLKRKGYSCSIDGSVIKVHLNEAVTMSFSDLVDLIDDSKHTLKDLGSGEYVFNKGAKNEIRFEYDKRKRQIVYDDEVYSVEEFYDDYIFDILNESADSYKSNFDISKLSDTELDTLVDMLKQNDVRFKLDGTYIAFNIGDLDASAQRQIATMIPDANVSEAVESESDFREYATALMKKAHGENFDQDKADKVINGLIDDTDGDWGKAVGKLQSSLK